MKLTYLQLTNFKNYTSAQIGMEERVNLFYGANGSGKTNVLDAIHFLSLSKSYFGMSDRHLIKDGADFYRVEGRYELASVGEKVSIKYQSKKEISINTEKLKRAADLVGRYPVVLIAPDDIKIVNGASKERRDFMNRWLCQSSPAYLKALMAYQRLLRQKDALLKADYAPSPLAIEALNHQMVQYAEEIYQHINGHLGDYVRHVQHQYGVISSQADNVEIKHITQLADMHISDLYHRAVQDEIRARRPLVGPQRDDYEYLIEGRPFKKYGSQGQIKTLLYGLRLAEYSCLEETLERSPIILLDDVFEKLDADRLSALFHTIHDGDYSQVFLSDTELERGAKIFDERGITFAAYRVTNGTIERTN